MRIGVTLLALLFCLPSAAEDRLPIIDMHLHANTLAQFGGPMTVCTNDQNIQFPGVDPRQPITPQAASVCDSPLQSALSDEMLLNDSLALLKRFNIYAVTSGSLETVTRWRAADPKRIIPAIEFEITTERTPADFRQLFLEDKFQVFAEVSPQYDGALATHENLDKYFALAEELDIPVGLHLGMGPPGGAHVMGYNGFKVALSSAIQIEDVVLKYPKLRIYVMHYGAPLVEDMIAVLYSHPQVFVDIAASDWSLPRAHFYRHLKMLIDAGFQKRIMFGSDQMIWPETIRIAIETIEEADFLSDQQKRDIFYGNAARFLRLSKEQIAAHHGQ